ncbi:uncharacterized protein L3040_001871 [Drepanopeziza brunnea f. sp. 'multigermtubi']|uniref:uncharacterized protein n=1 Tax=Drepanopeziza brunnea f. sp. 'multigermtubi' TaxID=698441 RepID=UPI00238FBA2C|nr:hypothetical protein L3040_001871 [Drepanopeziza brunnea f. sp. 'multigermtubi']
MAPPKSKPQPDDSRSEASSTKEKAGSHSANANGKGRRVAGNAAGGSSLKDVITAGTSGIGGGASATAVAESSSGIQWSSFDSSVLHGYRYDYRLNTPAAFKTSYNQLVLARSPIGRMSPTMARRKGQRRQSKEQLANTLWWTSCIRSDGKTRISACAFHLSDLDDTTVDARLSRWMA